MPPGRHAPRWGLRIHPAVTGLSMIDPTEHAADVPSGGGDAATTADRDGVELDKQAQDVPVTVELRLVR